ncbi:hypothetical protein BK796_23640, partial [Kosakonia pseudosacchari]
MNSFFLFSTALSNKDKNSAMLIIRDKSESVARKILQKAGVSVPSYSGRVFWQWVQDYILRACRTEKDINDSISQRNDVRTDVENTPLAGYQSG